MSETDLLTHWEGRSLEEWQREWRLPELHIFRLTASTNDVVRDRALAGAAAGTTAIADAQSAGRGRSGRTWNAVPEKSVLLSVLLRASEAGLDPSAMPLRVALAVARAIESTAGIRVLIKWPNDLVTAGSAKIAGILCEGVVAQGGPWIVAGIGINVLQQAADFPRELRGTAASLLSAGARVQRADLVGAVLDQLRPFRIAPPPFDAATLDEIRARDALAGHAITVDGEPLGIAGGIAADAALVVSTPQGTRTIRNGTVRLVEDTRSARSGRRSSPPRESFPCS